MPKNFRKRVKKSRPAPNTSHAQQPAKQVLPRHHALACRPVDDTLKDVFLSRFKQLDELVKSISSMLSVTLSASFIQLSLNMVYASVYPFFQSYNRYSYVQAINVYAASFAKVIDPAHHDLMHHIVDFYLSLQAYPDNLEQYSQAAPLLFTPLIFESVRFPLKSGNITSSEIELVDPRLNNMIDAFSFSGFILFLGGMVNLCLLVPSATLIITNAFDVFLLNPIIRAIFNSVFDMKTLSKIEFKHGIEGSYELVDRRLSAIRKQKNWLTPAVNQTFNVLKSYVLIMLFVNHSTELNWVPLIQFDNEEADYWKVCLYTISILLGLVFHSGYFTKEKRDMSAQEAALNALIDIFDGILSKDAVEMIVTEKVTDTMYCISIDHIAGVDDVNGNFKIFVAQCHRVFSEHGINVIPNKSNQQVYIDYNSEIVNLKDDIKTALAESVRSQQWTVIRRDESSSDSESAEVASPSYYSMLGSLWCRPQSTCGRQHRKGPKSQSVSPKVMQAVRPEDVIIEIDGYVYNSEDLRGSTMFPLDIGNRSEELSHFGVLDQSLCDDPQLVAKFIEQLRRGTCGGKGKNGIRMLRDPRVQDYKYEIKLRGVDARYYGHEIKYSNQSLIVFDQYEAHSHQRSAFRRA